MEDFERFSHKESTNLTELIVASWLLPCTYGYEITMRARGVFSSQSGVLFGRTQPPPSGKVAHFRLVLRPPPVTDL